MDIDKQNALISAALGLHTVKYEQKSWNASCGLPEETVTVITDINGKKLYLWTEYTRASSAHNDFIHPKNYAESLDAMQEAETLLVGQDGICYTYWENICECCGVSPDSNVTWWTAFATAGQRAEAFLKTINKWEY
jgi:hypothetical protein